MSSLNSLRTVTSSPSTSTNFHSSTSSSNDEDVYHETQSLLRCGLHAINSFLQNDPTLIPGRSLRIYTKDDFEHTAQIVLEQNLQLEGEQPNFTRRLFNPYRHWLGIGNYDINILLRILTEEGYRTRYIDKRLIQDILVSSTSSSLLSSSSSSSSSSSLTSFVEDPQTQSLVRSILWDTTVSLSKDNNEPSVSSSPILHGFLINIPSSIPYSTVLSGPYGTTTRSTTTDSSTAENATPTTSTVTGFLHRYILQPLNDTFIHGRHWFIFRIAKNYRWYNLDSRLPLPYECLEQENEIIHNLSSIAQYDGEIIRIYKETKVEEGKEIK